ncbi:hypothetical protein FHS81_001696 [Pseudochelatococcus contaminans]|uniref:Uncharacterized protein n=1 Tax=Pseudochelatococcus contaminans TaxID=1538103 RepID=A0A7W6EGP7_9HYPH|nr:hypothetical protein [Pseudochelatococcus contaminans]
MNIKISGVHLLQTFADAMFCTVENCILAIDASADMSRLWIEESVLHRGRIYQYGRSICCHGKFRSER